MQIIMASKTKQPGHRINIEWFISPSPATALLFLNRTAQTYRYELASLSPGMGLVSGVFIACELMAGKFRQMATDIASTPIDGISVRLAMRAQSLWRQEATRAEKAERLGASPLSPLA
jgi:hypothetical protein